MRIEELVRDISSKNGLRKKGERHTGPCPFCGGSKNSDKFSIFEKTGGYKCYACGEKGDAIKWLRTREGLSCPDAHERIGKECQTPDTCGAASECRFGNGEKVSPRKRRRRTAQVRQTDERVDTIPLIEPCFPKYVWTTWAEPFQEKAHTRLLQNEKALSYLAGRGISQEAVARFGLGYHPHQQQVPFESLGLEPYFDDVKQKKVEKLWVPAGLVLPIYDYGGALHRLRIRRPLFDREKFLEDLKYLQIKGSGKLPLVIKPENTLRGAVIVEAELDAFAIAAAHPDVAVISIGSLGAGVDQKVMDSLNRSPVVLVALDAEDKSADHIKKWISTFRHAKPWFVPEGKDPGDYYKLGGNLHEWIEQGLPSVSKDNGSVPDQQTASSADLRQDGLSSCVQAQQGGRGERNNKFDYEKVSLGAGQEIMVVDSEAAFQQFQSTGLPVWTLDELREFKVAADYQDNEKFGNALDVSTAVKDIFKGRLVRGRGKRSGDE